MSVTAACFGMNSAIASANNLMIYADGRGHSQFTAKAWVSFNGTGTVAIRDSHNVSSITDNGTGNYQANYANGLGNSAYCAIGNSTKSGGSASASNSSLAYVGEDRGTNHAVVETYRADGLTARDSTFVDLLVFAD